TSVSAQSPDTSGVRRALLVCLIALGGCGGHGAEKLPPVCTAGPTPILKALAAAPAPVRIEGVAISRCFNRGASADDTQVVGGDLLAVAQQLGVRATGDSEGSAALRLGYLIGAARRGAVRNGLGAELVRRLEQET